MSRAQLRLFCAAELPQEVRSGIHTHLGPWRTTYPDARWVSAGNLHLTLKFIGPSAADLVADISRSVATAAAQHDPFVVRLAGAGIFGRPSAVRVIWLGVGDGQGQLRGLAGDIERQLVPLGIAEDRRPYRAHLTVARCRGEALPEALGEQIRRAADSEWGQLLVSHVVLMQSELRPDGPVYAPVVQHRLGEG